MLFLNVIPQTYSHVPTIDEFHYKEIQLRDFPGGPVVKNLPSNVGDVGLIPGQGTKIPHAAGQLSLRTTTTELTCLNERVRVSQTTEPTHPGAWAPKLERENPHTTTTEKPSCRNEKPTSQRKIPCASTKTQCSQKKDNK